MVGDSVVFSQIAEAFSLTEEPVMDHTSIPTSSSRKIETKAKIDSEQVEKNHNRNILTLPQFQEPKVEIHQSSPEGKGRE